MVGRVVVAGDQNDRQRLGPHDDRAKLRYRRRSDNPTAISITSGAAVRANARAVLPLAPFAGNLVSGRF